MNLVDLIYGKKQPAMPAAVPPLDPESPEARHGVTDPMYAYGNPPGMTKPGNIDLRKLMAVGEPGTNHWGTVYSSNNELSNGRETVYPGIVNGQFLPATKENDGARRAVEQTGRHLGEFSNSDDASNYAQKLHVDWESPGIMGLVSGHSKPVGAPYPSSQYAPTEEARKKFKIKK